MQTRSISALLTAVLVSLPFMGLAPAPANAATSTARGLLLKLSATGGNWSLSTVEK
jgi:hypothetical protein